MFRTDNTEYTQQECDELNAEFERRFADGDWPIDREQAEKSFANEVAGR